MCGCAGSVRSTGGPEGQRVLVVKLARTHRNRPSLLRLRMMYPQPDDQQFELHSWHSEQPSSASRSSSDGSEVCPTWDSATGQVATAPASGPLDVHFT